MSDKWFDQYVARLEARTDHLTPYRPAQTDGLFHCPCCGFPTLEARGDFEICLVCWWEDDGQDDADADTVAGGPNGRYSLTQARANFRDHLHMYDDGAEIGDLKSGSRVRAALLDKVVACLEQGKMFDTGFFRAWRKRHEDEQDV